MEIIGPSGCGKTRLITRIIRERKEIINRPLDKVLYIYSHHQPVYDELAASDPNIIFTNRLEDIEEHASEGELLVIIDDWMDELVPRSEALKLVTRYFVKSCHHLRKFFLAL